MMKGGSGARKRLLRGGADGVAGDIDGLLLKEDEGPSQEGMEDDPNETNADMSKVRYHICMCRDSSCFFTVHCASNLFELRTWNCLCTIACCLLILIYQ